MEQLIVGIVIGVFYVVSLFLAFMTGLGWNKKNTTDDEEL